MSTFPRILPVLGHARHLLWDDTTVIIYGTEVGGKQGPDNHLAIRRTVGTVPADVKRLMLSLDEWDESVMRDRVSDGVQCVVPLVAGTCAGYCWVTRSQLDIEEVGVKRALAPGHIWIFHCHIAAALRGQGLYPDTLRSIVNEMAPAGQAVAWIGAKSTNVRSLHGIQKAGFREVARIRQRTVCGVTVARTLSLTRGEPLVDVFPVRKEMGRIPSGTTVTAKFEPVHPSFFRRLRR